MLINVPVFWCSKNGIPKIEGLRKTTKHLVRIVKSTHAIQNGYFLMIK
jgi:hypothetical protein